MTIVALIVMWLGDDHIDDDVNYIGWAFIADTILGIIIGVERGQ
jgi:hypothetical protein